jgi:sulfur-oxidizing protein SoxB
MRLGGKLIEAGKKYKVAGWAPVAEEAKAQCTQDHRCSA